MKKILKLLFAAALITMNMVVISCSDNSHSSDPTYCKVTFMNLGTEFKTELVESGKKVAEPASPTRNGYTFNGWYDNSLKFDFSKSITSDIVLTARWTIEITYTITFNSAGGNEITSQTVKSGEKAIAPTPPTKDGYEFLGWHDRDDTVFDFENTFINKNISLTAKWKLKVPNYLEVEETEVYVNNKYETHYTITSYIEEKFPEDGVVTIPGNITNIDDRAFQNCTELTAVHIPASVTSIGIAAFKGCVNLKSATFENICWYYKTSPYMAAKQITWSSSYTDTNALWLTGTYSAYRLSTTNK
ncbi:MAG: InlB B-repeat-containing protein [Treponemataceae bacterium]|nr:InlB B-repeat-containing protein [Treponemataceae bacterium]